ncbi:hypothetical protein HNR62_001026 [Oceanisphaera litoralis]|uniref:hypothetical protein n=1 Tax=Oceanisphaera litoralis TaxID=225144 RepID=UPI00195A1583|nr:hypothetical protein [Oceanisphaera litoralis]MBM7455166.1 hypothetical protein [Oceanisphaera litoralis]
MFALYLPTTGQITRMVDAPLSFVSAQLQEGELAAWVGDGVQDQTHWIDDEAMVQPKGDYKLEALPLPCAISIEDVTYPCTEQPEFEFDAPGTYLIQVDAGPQYLRKEFTIENPA